MEYRCRSGAWSIGGWSWSIAISFALAWVAGCGGQVDARFSAPAYDEYTEPLTNAAPVPAATGGAVGVESIGGTSSWHFDDCDPNSHFLIDSTGGVPAHRARGDTCVPGISGQGVLIRTAKDVVQVPDQPQFTVESRVAVAAWVHPNTVDGDQPIVIKRLKNQTAFSLGIHNGNIEMAVVLTGGKTFISRAPIAAGIWTHVAGMYDGTVVSVFINGEQFGQVNAGGTLRNVCAPIRIGATTQSEHFDGIIDEVFLSTENIGKDVLTALSCMKRPTTLAISPATSGPVPFDTTVDYDIAVTDNDVGRCPSRSYEKFLAKDDLTIRPLFDPSFGPALFLGTGETKHMSVGVTGSEETTPGAHEIIVGLSGPPPENEEISAQLTYEVFTPNCFVSRRELLITNTSVVDDRVRTAGLDSSGQCRLPVLDRNDRF